MSFEVETEFKKLFNVEFGQGYGLTEMPAGTAVTPFDRIRSRSVGFLLPNVEAKVVHTETGKELGYNEDGELWYRGPNMMDGYLNRPEENIIDKDGFLHSGDIGHIDEDGYLYIVDRLKELIKYKGFQVPPAEIEALLLTHPQLADVGVIGKKDVVNNEELPMAFVVLKPNATISEKEITDFVAGKVAFHKQLRGGVVFVDSIPRNMSGKILRRVLRESLTKLNAKI